MANKIDRREFMTLMGLGGAAAATMSCGGGPNYDEHWHPWVEPVEGTIPYVPRYYATTSREADGCGLWIKVLDGRAQKVEGNPDHPINKGSVTARQQSLVQSLYGADRIRQPRKKDGTEITWNAAMKMLNDNLAGARGKSGNVSALTGPVTGSVHALWTRFVAEHGSGRHAQYTAFTQSELVTASEKAFGQSSVPLVSLEGADYVVSLGARFLETWGDVTANSRHYADMKTPHVEGDDHGHGGHGPSLKGNRGKHVQFEGITSGTGASADEVHYAKPGSETDIALALLREVAANASGLAAEDKERIDSLIGDATIEKAAASSGIDAEALKHVADELAHAKSAVILPAESMAIAGDVVAHHIAVLLLNKAVGGIGRHFNYAAGKPIAHVPSHKEILDLTASLNAGEVDVLVLNGTNAAYSLPADVKFADAVGKAGFTVAFADETSETTALADLVIPVTHDLESWGEISTYTGMDMLMQPTMRPRWTARQVEDHLIEAINIAVEGAIAQTNYREYLQASWLERFGAGSANPKGFWNDCLKKGGRFEIPAGSDLPISGNLAADTFSNTGGAVGDPALVVVESSRYGDGTASNRGWMQELPDAMTGMTWDSWLEISVAAAKKQGLDYGDKVTLSANGKSVTVPVFLSETASDHTVTLATGMGRKEVHEPYRRGVNAFTLLGAELNSGGRFSAGPMKAGIKKAGGREKMATIHLPGKGDQTVTPYSQEFAPIKEFDRGIFNTVVREDSGKLVEHGGHHEVFNTKSDFPIHGKVDEHGNMEHAEGKNHYYDRKSFYKYRGEDKVIIGRDGKVLRSAQMGTGH